VGKEPIVGPRARVHILLNLAFKVGQKFELRLGPTDLRVVNLDTTAQLLRVPRSGEKERAQDENAAPERRTLDHGT
jgi:hypothetical protein